MAEPAVLDLYIRQGDTHRRQFTVWTDATMTTAVNITGWTFAAQIRTGAADAALTAAATFETVIVSATGGVFEIVVHPVATTPLNPEVMHYWDLQATTDAGDVLTLLAGQVTVGAEITR